MNPMSLLNLSPDALREAALNDRRGSPSGERAERAAVSLCMLLLASGAFALALRFAF